jgi:RNA polymerase sigma factor (sigma-70 family)
VEENLLIEELINADQRAFKDLVEQYKDKVFNTCLGLLHNSNDAEDITQEVFVEIFLSIKNFKSQSKLSTWIYRISISKALDLIRRNKRKKRFAFFTSFFGVEGEFIHDPPDFVHPGVQAENKELSIILFKAIAKLTESQKISFTLNKIEGLNYEEIAEIMKISKSAVESLLFRAKQKLKLLLTNYYKEFK